jgi:DNA-binding LacI/PurR family transcriptional regulator
MHLPDSYHRAVRTLELPEVFVCANAMIAIQLMKAIQEEKLTLSERAGLVVFETTHDLVYNGKMLIAVNVSRKQIASSLCMLLFDRMQNPDTTKRTVKLNSRIEIF